MANYKFNEETMYKDIEEGIAIVVNSATNEYFGMNSFATEIFENIIKGVSTENILAAIKKIEGVPKNIETKLKNFIKELLDNNILINSTQITPSPVLVPAVINSKYAENDMFNIAFAKFDAFLASMRGDLIAVGHTSPD